MTGLAETAIFAALMITSVLAITGMAMMAFGYRKSLFSKDHTTRWFVWSIFLLSLGFFWRRMYWDILDPLLHNDQFAQQPESLNILFNMVAILAVYCGLKARHGLIPSDERPYWRWWNAWAHPGFFNIRLRANGTPTETERTHHD